MVAELATTEVPSARLNPVDSITEDGAINGDVAALVATAAKLRIGRQTWAFVAHPIRLHLRRHFDVVIAAAVVHQIVRSTASSVASSIPRNALAIIGLDGAIGGDQVRLAVAVTISSWPQPGAPDLFAIVCGDDCMWVNRIHSPFAAGELVGLQVRRVDPQNLAGSSGRRSVGGHLNVGFQGPQI